MCVIKKIILSAMGRKDLKRNYVVLGKPTGILDVLIGSGMRVVATISNLQGREAGHTEHQKLYMRCSKSHS